MVVSLDGRALAATFHAYNRLLHVPPTSVPIGGPLATDTDFAAADRAFEKCRPLPVVIDNALSTEALEELQGFSRDATIWFEVKDHGGHLGAYFEEGLACELLIATADALRRALPRNLEGLGACPNSRCSILSESDSSLSYEQVFSALEYRSDTAAAAECA
jgi:hypothetical protein